MKINSHNVSLIRLFLIQVTSFELGSCKAWDTCYCLSGLEWPALTIFAATMNNMESWIRLCQSVRVFKWALRSHSALHSGHAAFIVKNVHFLRNSGNLVNIWNVLLKPNFLVVDRTVRPTRTLSLSLSSINPYLLWSFQKRLVSKDVETYLVSWNVFSKPV